LPDADLSGLDPLYRLYPCREGWIFLAATAPHEAEALYTALAETGHPVSGSVTLADVFGRRSAAEWEKLLAPRGIGCVRADTPGLAAFLWHDPLARACGLVGDAPHKTWGTYRRHGRIVDYDHASALRGAPDLGEHTRAILAELGWRADDVEGLLASRAALAS